MLEFEPDTFLIDGLGSFSGYLPLNFAKDYFPKGVKAIEAALVSGLIPERYFTSDADALGAIYYRLEHAAFKPGYYGNSEQLMTLVLVGVVDYQHGNSWHKSCIVGRLIDDGRESELTEHEGIVRDEQYFQEGHSSPANPPVEDVRETSIS